MLVGVSKIPVTNFVNKGRDLHRLLGNANEYEWIAGQIATIFSDKSFEVSQSISKEKQSS
jgi:hypothetical protein